MPLSKSIYAIFSIACLLLGLYIQFLFAEFYQGDFLNVFYLGVSFCSVVISMSSGGLGGFLISRFSNISEALSLNVAVFSFTIIFSIIGIGVFCALLYTSFFLLKMALHQSLIISFLFFLYLLSLALNLIFQSYSYSRKGVSGPIFYEFCSLISYVLIVFLLVINKKNYVLCCMLFCVRGYFQLIFYYVFCKEKISFRLIKCDEVKYFFDEVKYLMSGSAYYKSEPLIDRFFLVASYHNLAAYHLISQIYNAALGLWFKISVSPLVNKLTQNATNTIVFMRLFRRGLLSQCIISIISAIVLFFTPTLHYLESLNIFRPIAQNADVVYLLFIFFVASLLGQVVSNAYYSVGYHKTPIIVSCITYTLFLPAKYYLVKRYGVPGLCILVSLYHTVNFIILWLMFRVKDES
ncbi:hypothetical protein [Escherichia marmotae]|uniref:hypothetical protein n=1 Tax=Escherichia marmotae TaxID=1499973 RepID=UPI0016503410|nr:hypothetical protein [Escherichia marmotae]MBC6523680.1 hypothetical protein [Escherichia marmotae]MED9513841.1 hypothetical protein [Escherichia marmotae]